MSASDTRWVCERACTSKDALSRGEARQRAERLRRLGERVTAYRCPFSADHADPFRKWHVGHPAPMSTLEAIAVEIRRRQGYEVDMPRARGQR